MALTQQNNQQQKPSHRLLKSAYEKKPISLDAIRYHRKESNGWKPVSLENFAAELHTTIKTLQSIERATLCRMREVVLTI